MEHLQAQLLGRYFKGQRQLLDALILNPCQSRQFFLNEGITAEEFGRQYAVLRQVGMACELDVPVYKNGHQTERRATVYRAFPEQLVAQCLVPVAAGVLPREHFLLVQALAAAGRLTLDELGQRARAGRGERELAEMEPVSETLAQLVRQRVVVAEEDYDLGHRRTILLEYVEANDPGAGPTQKRGRGAAGPGRAGAAARPARLPPDLQQIYDLQSAPQTSGYYVLDRAVLARFSQVRLCLQNVRLLADEATYVVAALACAASQVHCSALPPSFTSQELAEELVRLQTAAPGEQQLVTGYSATQFGQLAGQLSGASVQLAVQRLLELQVLLQSFDHFAVNADFFGTGCKLQVIQRLLCERYQREAGRIFRLLQLRRFLSEAQIEYEAMVGHPACVQLLNDLHRDGFVELAAAGKGEWGEKAQALYAVDEARAALAGRDLAARVLAGLLDLQDSVGQNAAVDDMHARASQVAFAVGRYAELLCVLL